MSEIENMSETVIKAQDALEGEIYLTTYMKYKVKVLRKHYAGDVCTRVSVEAETYPGRVLDISGGTELIPFNNELHTLNNNNKRKDEMDTNQNQSAAVAAVKKPSRAKVIDKELLTAGDSPTAEFYEALATKVLSACGETDTEDKRKAIITQAKVRWSWYYKQGKPNPQA